MKVKVERCFSRETYYRLTLPDGTREYIDSETWDRKSAKEALDLLEKVYHIPRRTIRFAVH